jgi:hypothetical protein
MRNSRSGIPGIHGNGSRGYYVNYVVMRSAGAVVRKKYFPNIEEAIAFKRSNKEIIKL